MPWPAAQTTCTVPVAGWSELKMYWLAATWVRLEAGLLLILAVDHFLDMGRSATNVVGNAVASSVIARWEGTLDPIEPADIEPPHAPSHGHAAPKS